MQHRVVCLAVASLAGVAATAVVGGCPAAALPSDPVAPDVLVVADGSESSDAQAMPIDGDVTLVAAAGALIGLEPMIDLPTNNDDFDLYIAQLPAGPGSFGEGTGELYVQRTVVSGAHDAD